MDVNDAVLSRLTVREYKPDAVPDEVVHKLLEAGRLAPSSQNLQPWHFIVVRDGDTIRRLGELATQGPFVGNAPLAIAIATDDTPRAQLDAGRALQQMELVAWEEGMGTCFVGIRQAEQNQAIKDLLGIPDHLVLLTVCRSATGSTPIWAGSDEGIAGAWLMWRMRSGLARRMRRNRWRHQPLSATLI